MTAPQFGTRNLLHPCGLTDGLREGEIRHVLSDGSWSLVDALMSIAKVTGPETNIDLSTWSAADADTRQIMHFMRSGQLRSLRLLVDCSFVTRKPQVCAAVRKLFGDDALRVWNSHAKFAIFYGGDLDALLISSANLNRNPRIENFTLFTDPAMVKEYRALVDELWERQNPTDGFTNKAGARQLSFELLGSARPGPWKKPRPAHPDIEALKDWS